MPSAAAQSPGYRLNPGDEIRISVWNEDDLDRSVSILPDGTVSFPLVGQVQVAQKTVPEVEEAISAALKEKIRDAEVSVMVTSIAGNRVFLYGEVASPGSFIMTSRMNVLQLITMAGGVTPYGNRNRIEIHRGSGPERFKLIVNLREILDGDATSDYILAAGDVVIVP